MLVAFRVQGVGIVAINNYWSQHSRRVSRRGVLRGAAVTAAGAGAWAFAGCGDDDNDDETPSPAATTGGGAASPAASPSAAAQPQPRRGGKVVYATQFDPANLDPHKLGTAYVWWGPGGSAYSTLVKPQATGHKLTLIAAPDLAAKWEQPDPTTFVFHLRPNAKFQNVAPVNGRVATAEDVVYSFKRQIAEKVNASSLGALATVEALDATTVRLKTAVPDADFLGALCDPRNMVLAREAVELKGDLTNGPTIGTGPWIAKEWRKGQTSVYVRNPDYFDPALPYADELQYPIISDATQTEAQFRAGNLTVASQLLSVATRKRLAAIEGNTLFSGASQPNHWTHPNFRAPEFKDPRVAKALSMAIDRDLLVANALEGVGGWDGMGTIMPGESWFLPQSELKKAFGYDPKAAKALLDAAGGFPKATMHYYAILGQATAEIIQASWRAIGVDVTLQAAESAQAVGDIFNPAVARYTIMTTPILHASTLTGDLEIWYKTGGSRNSSFISDPNLDRLIDAQKSEFNEAKRKDLVNQIERLIIEKAYHIGLTKAPSQYVHSKKVHSVEPLWINGTHQWLSEVWFDA